MNKPLRKIFIYLGSLLLGLIPALVWANQAPQVDAGSDQTLGFGSTVNVAGTATDDGLPNPPGDLTYQWSKQNGPGSATFDNPQSSSSAVSFSKSGSYRLKLSAKVTVPGPDNFDQVKLTTPGGLGRPSSLTVPLRLATSGKVTVRLVPAFTCGA